MLPAEAAAFSLTSEGKAAEVERLIAPTVADLGFEIVRVQLGGGQRRPTLQVMIERPDGSLAIEDCVAVSHAVSALLEVEDPIDGAYELEVSSPGIDRPLTRAKDFLRWAGYEAKVELKLPIEGRRRIKGRLIGLEGTDVILAEAAGQPQVRLPLSAIGKAKLVLTDDLLAAGQAGEPDA
ncbi:ribosome maturation factor RimP [Tistlia consotensis]|uniref:Ribosome maturation factor RimP n=1 Tax=Tistlia consotensis USBA 355 TaxID=560819 RepID=A0A1Y6CTZ0_9PROT|nr:ribosome maturation factor RimP [Tistlia consotensis]SMF74518.1 ribosome maturation factor RimP [Tistlia consotensis USBA 355]SNS10775.1 ribosome maturation factor RimP [Tistlia consotensis]